MDQLTQFPHPRAASAGGEYVAISQLMSYVWRRIWLILGCALLVSVAVMSALLLRERQYTSSASFVPQSSDKLSALAGLAAQFGVSAGGPDPTESPAFFADLLSTREVLSTVLRSEYRFPDGDRTASGKLIDLLNVQESTEGRKMVKGIEKLSKSISVVHKARTGVISVDVTMPNPFLAQAVAQRFLDEVSTFSLNKRNTRAGAERRFTEGRIAELQDEMRAAEDRLKTFLQENRDYRNSPELTFQHDRLAQDMEFRRSVYTTVAQSNERARMDEVRDTPVITVIETPNLPARPDSRGLAKFGLLSLILGGIIGVGVAVGLDPLRQRGRLTWDPDSNIHAE